MAADRPTTPIDREDLAKMCQDGIEAVKKERESVILNIVEAQEDFEREKRTYNKKLDEINRLKQKREKLTNNIRFLEDMIRVARYSKLL